MKSGPRPADRGLRSRLRRDHDKGKGNKQVSGSLYPRRSWTSPASTKGRYASGGPRSAAWVKAVAICGA